MQIKLGECNRGMNHLDISMQELETTDIILLVRSTTKRLFDWVMFTLDLVVFTGPKENAFVTQ